MAKQCTRWFKRRFRQGAPDVFLDRYHSAGGKEIIKERTFLPVIDEGGRVHTITLVSGTSPKPSNAMKRSRT